MIVGYKDLNQVVVVGMQGSRFGSGSRDVGILCGGVGRDTRIYFR